MTTTTPAADAALPGGELATEINRHHSLACLRADEAIQHAQEAGKLLLQVKAGMKHGDWLPWLAANVQVSARQAQRYIAAAQGKPTAIRAWNQRHPVSHLASGASAANGWTPQPTFIPQRGVWYWCLAAGRPSFVVEPAKNDEGFFFVSRLNYGGHTYDCTHRPVAAAWVESNLQMFGLADPAGAEWLKQPSDGVRVALETLNSAETTQARLAHKETIPEAIERMKRTNAMSTLGQPAQGRAA